MLAKSLPAYLLGFVADHQTKERRSKMLSIPKSHGRAIYQSCLSSLSPNDIVSSASRLTCVWYSILRTCSLWPGQRMAPLGVKVGCLLDHAMRFEGSRSGNSKGGGGGSPLFGWLNGDVVGGIRRGDGQGETRRLAPKSCDDLVSKEERASLYLDTDELIG